MFDAAKVLRSIGPAHTPRMPWSRINSFVDGISGFAATVLMLRLGTPVYTEGDLGAALDQQAPYYLLYAGGFLQIVGSWSVLRRLSAWTTGVDFYGAVLAFLALMMWAAQPFTVDVLAGAIDDREDFVAAMRLMSLTLVVGMLAYTGLWWRLESTGAFRPGLDPDVFAFVRVVSYTVAGWPIAAYLLTYVNPWASLAAVTGVVLISLVPLEALSTEQYAALD